ncbi:MAG: Gfo/Idh/MocA family oxidoreductase [Bacteroidaceae bacterium]|nr:Gfo/Idh/MocA family oxidoreductase [Bacteroidaceae bacterium]
MMITRRVFLRQSASAVAATLILPQALQSRPIRSGAASDQLRVALIGCRSMGWGDLTDVMNHPNMYCAALCDINQNILSSRANEAQKLWGNRPDTYSDYRRILDRKDIDAVVIGTPDHWHCLMMTDACSAGKDVYVEKPIANSIIECDAMVAAQQRYGRVVQVGQQQRSSHLWHEMKRIVDSGQLGTIPRVNVWANFAYAAILNPAKDGPTPEGIDFEMWLGPAPQRPFNETRLNGLWRMFWDYGGGLLTDWGVHLLDMAFWGMNVKEMPLRVMGSGANHAYPNNFAETFDTLSVFYGYPDFLIQWSNVAIESGPYGMNYGLEFKGTQGTLVVNREKMELYPLGEKQPSQQWKPTNNEHYDHTTNFIDCVREHRFDTACTIQNGAFCAKMAHLGNIAARTGQALTFDDQRRTFHDKAADKLIAHAYRKPWRMPKI